MKCLKPIKVNGNFFNCGQCHCCRVNYTSQWALRCLYELSSWNSASFVTLTYDNDHLQSFSLIPKDLTDFIKRLRRDLPEGRKIKYYACGEYGDKSKRPHFHLIIFGIDNYNNEDRDLIRSNWLKCEDFLFAPISQNRKHSAIEPVCRESIAYVTGYVQKKLKGINAVEEYDSKGLVRPFSRCSRGIGLDFALEHKERLINNGFTFYNGKIIGIPKYLREKLGIQQKDLISSSSSMWSDSQSKELHNQFVQFYKQYGLDYSEITMKNINSYARRFEQWFENRQFGLAEQSEKDFLKRQNIKGGKV